MGVIVAIFVLKSVKRKILTALIEDNYWKVLYTISDCYTIISIECLLIDHVWSKNVFECTNWIYIQLVIIDNCWLYDIQHVTV